MEWIHSGRTMDDRFANLLAGAADSEPLHRVAGETLSYTSGTTRLPKAVLRKPAGIAPEGALRLPLEWYARSFGIDPSTPGAFLNACPLYFSGPMSFASYAVHMGRTLVLMPQWSARLALGLITRHQVSDTFVVPFQLAELIREYRNKPDAYDLGNLRAIIHGSAPCPAELKQQALDTFGEIVYECYGSTEVAGTVATPQAARLYRGTVGRAVPPQEVRILDDYGQPCPPAVGGKIYMKMFPDWSSTTRMMQKGQAPVSATASPQQATSDFLMKPAICS